MTPENNDVISLSDLAVTLIKHIKLWLVLFIIGVLGVMVYGTYHQDSYQFDSYLRGPTYIDNGNVHGVMSQSEFSSLLDIYAQQVDESSSKYPLIKGMQYDKEKLTLRIKTYKSQAKQVEEMFAWFVDYVEKKPQYVENLTNWQDNMQLNILQLQTQNKIYAETAQQFQRNVDNLCKAKDIGYVNGQTLLHNLSSAILSYETQMFSNDVQIQHYQSRLRTLDKHIRMLGSLVRSRDILGLSFPVIVILGTILSLIFATLIVFMVEFFTNLRVEIKQKLSHKHE